MYLNRLWRIAIGCILIATILHFIFPIFIVHGESMEDTLGNNDVIVGVRCFRHVERGQIVIAQQLDANGTLTPVVKRVIGLAGDEVEITTGSVIVNNITVMTLGTADAAIIKTCKVSVPENCIFVLGDNYNNSYDSRFTECVDLDSVSARVIFDASRVTWID